MVKPCFIDGLGRRSATTGPDGERLETLHVCAEIPATPKFQAAIVERASSLAHFTHPAFAAVRRVERHGESPRASLAIVSEAVDGVRLSDLLRESERRRGARDVDAAMHLLQEAVGAAAALHRHGPEISHGAIGPERVVLRPDGSVVLVEHALAGVLDALEFSRLQLWTLFRVPAPAAASAVRLDQQADVLQLGVLALALLLGRVLRREEFPQALPTVLEEATVPDGGRDYPGCSRAIRAWLGRALQFEPRTAFRSAVEAERALNAALQQDALCRPSAAAVQRFLASCSFETLGCSAAIGTPAPRTSATGALVSVGPVDRGSGAHRVSRQPPPALSVPVVLAEVAASPPTPSPAPPTPDTREHAVDAAPPEGPARRAERRHFGFSILRFPLGRSR